MRWLYLSRVKLTEACPSRRERVPVQDEGAGGGREARFEIVEQGLDQVGASLGVMVEQCAELGVDELLDPGDVFRVRRGEPRPRVPKARRR